MTEKELKKLNRYQLLELIIIQTEELEKVKTQLAETQQKLEERILQIEQAGSIANAALQLGGVFEAAQAAADMYLENIKEKHQQAEKLLADAKIKAAQILKDAGADADDMAEPDCGIETAEPECDADAAEADCGADGTQAESNDAEEACACGSAETEQCEAVETENGAEAEPDKETAVTADEKVETDEEEQ